MSRAGCPSLSPPRHEREHGRQHALSGGDALEAGGGKGDVLSLGRTGGVGQSRLLHLAFLLSLSSFGLGRTHPLPPFPLLYTHHLNSSPPSHPPHISRYLTLSSHRIASRYPLPFTTYVPPTPILTIRNSIPPSSLARSRSHLPYLSVFSLFCLSSLVSRLVPIALTSVEPPHRNDYPLSFLLSFIRSVSQSFGLRVHVGVGTLHLRPPLSIPLLPPPGPGLQVVVKRTHTREMNVLVLVLVQPVPPVSVLIHSASRYSIFNPWVLHRGSVFESSEFA